MAPAKGSPMQRFRARSLCHSSIIDAASAEDDGKEMRRRNLEDKVPLLTPHFPGAIRPFGPKSASRRVARRRPLPHGRGEEARPTLWMTEVDQLADGGERAQLRASPGRDILYIQCRFLSTSVRGAGSSARM